LPGVLIAKLAIWGFVLPAFGQFAKPQLEERLGWLRESAREVRAWS
jgi:hypothetical protein